MRVVRKKHDKLDKWIELEIDGVEVRVDNDDVDPKHAQHVVNAIVDALKKTDPPGWPGVSAEGEVDGNDET